jgi:multidrug efflux pump subunit AcrA (membrane-fusion protein)
LAATKESSLQREIERSERLVQSGTEAARDLALQRTSLLETRISNQRDLYEAETAIKTAQRNRTAASTQLLQAGLDPEMLQAATNDVDIVAAEVPEGKIGLVSVGQACTASFFGIPDHEFRGRVAALSPVLSSEYRTLRVLFIIHDPEDQLRPGMFAAIGLGSDPRPVIRIPAESVIHIDRDDYVLRVCSPEDGVALKPRSLPAELERLQLQGSAIEVAENVQGRVEVLKGLQPGDQIASGAVILLKPTLTAALKDSAARAARLLPERHAH